jgi:predicted deacylase
MPAQEFIFHNQKFSSGSRGVVEFDVARLPSGTLIHMPVHVFHGLKPGPVVLLSGGLHGDEINGIEIVRRIIAGNLLHKLRAGTVLAIPIINAYGFINFSRDVPDGKDVNRSFPGSPDGSLASIVANTLTTKVLPHIDFGIDFHTGGASRTNHPQVRFDREDRKSAALAKAFKAPFTLHSGIISGSLRGTARDLGKSIIVFEGGESLRFSEPAIIEGIKGTRRVLQHLNLLEKAPKAGKQKYFKQSNWLRAEVSGLFQFLRQSGQKVKEGQIIGIINSPHNDYAVKVYSPYNGYIIGHNNFPLVHKGDAIFHIGHDLWHPTEANPEF